MSSKPAVDDGAAERLEPVDVERDVVVDEEDRLGAVRARVRDVGQHALDRVGMEVAAAHLDDRTETAVERAAARGLDDVHLPPEQRVALTARARHGSAAAAASIASRRTGRSGLCSEAVAGSIATGRRPSRTRRRRSSARSSSHSVCSPSPRTMKSTSGQARIGVGRQARIVAADDDSRRRPERSHQPRDRHRGRALKRHHRQRRRHRVRCRARGARLLPATVD